MMNGCMCVDEVTGEVLEYETDCNKPCNTSSNGMGFLDDMIEEIINLILKLNITFFQLLF